MNYVDGFVVPVRKDRLDDYRDLSQKCSKVWKEHGALDYVECVADDVQPGTQVSFERAVKCKPGEVVLMSYILYRSRAHRDRVNKQVMADPRIAAMTGPDTCPFDPKRMMWGGFKSIVAF